jgi:hypothetical protein
MIHAQPCSAADRDAIKKGLIDASKRETMVRGT